MKEREQLLKKRNRLKKKATKITQLKKGDNRISSSSRVCAVCGKRLSTFDKINGKSYVLNNHYHLYYSDLVQSDICTTLDKCYKYFKERDENFEI